MKTGVSIPRPRFPRSAQVSQLLAAGVPESRIYVVGERGETIEAAFKAARDRTVNCPDGFRVFGTSQKAIRAALIAAERRGIVIVDAGNGQRSDKQPWEMYDLAVGRGRIEERRLDKRAARRGGQTRAARYANDRLPEDKAERIWKDKRFVDAKAACAYMNELHPPKIEGHKGWTPQLAYQHFGGSSRPRGRKSSKPKGRK